MACNETGYTGQNYCNPNSNFGEPTGIILASSDHSMTAANFALEDSWIADIKSGKLFPFMGLDNFEENSSDATMYEYTSRRRKKNG